MGPARLLEVNEMNGVSPWKIGFVDLGAILFVIGGVVSLITTILTIPVASIYPFRPPTSFSTVLLAALAIGLVCSLGAIHCYSLTAKRMLSEAGMRGVIFGVLLLVLSLGLFDSFGGPGTLILPTAVSAVMILIAGVICFVLRHSIVSTPILMRQQPISQHA
jgi:hypothetical protein